jgi:hypothetical protein
VLSIEQTGHPALGKRPAGDPRLSAGQCVAPVVQCLGDPADLLDALDLWYGSPGTLVRGERSLVVLPGGHVELEAVRLSAEASELLSEDGDVLVCKALSSVECEEAHDAVDAVRPPAPCGEGAACHDRSEEQPLHRDLLSRSASVTTWSKGSRTATPLTARA